MDSVNNSSIEYFKCCCRYIDDLYNPNGINEFVTVAKSIYPDCLVLEKTNTSNLRMSFLDLDISIKNKRFSTKLYDKRTDFNFSVIPMPNLKSNVPRMQTYGIFYSQLSRLCNSNSCIERFIRGQIIEAKL